MLWNFGGTKLCKIKLYGHTAQVQDKGQHRPQNTPKWLNKSKIISNAAICKIINYWTIAASVNSRFLVWFLDIT
jgi:hypothetical protein